MDARSDAHERWLDACSEFTSLVQAIEKVLGITTFRTSASVFVTIANGIRIAKVTSEGTNTVLSNLSARLREIAWHFGNSDKPDFESELYAYTLKFLGRAREIEDILNPRREQAMNENTLEAIVDGIDKEMLDLHAYLEQFMTRALDKIRDLLFNDPMTGYYTPSAQYSFGVVKNRPHLRSCTEGTRVDILKRITDWAADPSSTPILLLSGISGVGKSTIAYTACQQFLRKHTLGASFFCSRQTPALRRLENIVPNIAYQLAQYSHSFAGEISRVQRIETDRQVEKLLVDQWVSAMAVKTSTYHVTDSDVLRRERVRSLPPVVIVIDGLDEIEGNRGVALLQNFIDQMSTSSSWPSATRTLKVLVTSCPFIPDANVEYRLEYRLERIEVHHSRQDVLKFLTKSLPDLASQHSNILDELVERSGGFFLHAATVARLLSSQEFPHRLFWQRQRDWLLRFLEAPHTSSPAPTTAIHELYKHLIDEASSKVQLQRLLPVLHRIVCARQPLSTHIHARMSDIECEENVNMDIHTSSVEALHVLLYISASDSCIYFYHHSFFDFMVDSGLSGPELAYTSSAASANLMMTRGCLRLMQASLRFNICGLPSSYLLDSEVPNLAKTIKANVLDIPGLEYACRHWTSHIVEVSSSDAITQLLYEYLSDFVDETVLFWMEVMSLLKAHASGQDELKGVLNWVNKQNIAAPSALSRALMSASHICESFFRTEASSSTPHLYISCLPLEIGLNPDVPALWKSRFAAIPGIDCSGVGEKDDSPTDPYRPHRRSFFGAVTNVHATAWGISSVAFSPDGTRIVSGSHDSSIDIWNASNGAHIHKLVGHTEWVNSVAYSPDGTRIVSGSEDESVRIWDALTGAEVHKLEGHTQIVNCAVFSSSSMHVVSGSDDNSVRIWNASTGANMRELSGHTDRVHSVAYSPDGKRVVSGSRDGSVRVWPIATGGKVLRVRVNKNLTARDLANDYLEDEELSSVYSVAFSPNGTQIVLGSADHSVRIWDSVTGAEVRKLDGHTDAVYSVAFSLDGIHVVSSSGEDRSYRADPDNNSVRIWNTLDGAEVYKLIGHTSAVKSVAFSPDGKRVISGSLDSSVRIWNTPTRKENHSIRGHTDFVFSVAFSRDSRQAVSCSNDASVRIWDASTCTEVRKFEGLVHCARSVAFSPDGARIVLGFDNGYGRVWDAASGVEILELHGHTDMISSVAFSSDGSRIASSSRDESVRVWDALSGTEELRLDGHIGWVHCAAFSSDGTRIVSASNDKSVRVWNAFTGEQVHKLDGHTDWVFSAAFSPDGTRAVSGSNDSTVRIWDALNGTEIHRLEGHTDWVRSVAFSPDGTHIVSGSKDKSLRVWDAAEGKTLYRLEGHTDLVRSVAFSSNSKRIVSGSDDSTIRFWDEPAHRTASMLFREGSPLVKSRANHWSHDTLPTSWVARTPEHAHGVPNGEQDLGRSLWLPHPLRTNLYDGKICTHVIAQRDVVRADFTNAYIGSDWAKCYQP